MARGCWLHAALQVPRGLAAVVAEVRQALLPMRRREAHAGELEHLMIGAAHRFSLQRGTIMDAIRMSDGRIVTIKRVEKSYTPLEESIIRLFSTEPLALNPHNHSIPLYDVLQSPRDETATLLVMPYLVRIHQYPFATVGEAVECFRQLFEASRLSFPSALCRADTAHLQGLSFVHQNLVAHW